LQFYIIENLFLLYFRQETIRQIKIIVLKKEQALDIKSLLKALLLWILEFVLIHIFIIVIEPKNSLLEEWWKFFSYQELGLPQGIILVPLLFFASKMKMKQDVSIAIKKLISIQDLKNLKISYSFFLISLGFWGLLIGLNYNFHFHAVFNIPIILILLVFRGFQRI
jgi:hypothetical protein